MGDLLSCIDDCMTKFANKCQPVQIDKEMVRSRCVMGCTDSDYSENVVNQTVNMIYLRKGCKYFEKPQVVKEPEKMQEKPKEKMGLLLGLIFLFVMALPPMRAAAAAVMMKNGKRDGA